MSVPALVEPSKLASLGSRLPFRRISRRELLVFTTGLATLQKAGIPLLQGLRGMAESSTSERFGDKIEDLAASIEGGASLSRALSRHPDAFDPFFVNMVSVGEASGRLDEVLERLAETIEREDELSSQLKAASAYPVLSLLLCMSIITFILLVIVPRFMRTFIDSDIPIPLPTQVVLAASQFLQNNVLLIVVVLLLLPIGFGFLKQVPEIRYVIDVVKLKLPLVGALHKKVLITRFSRGLQLLTDAGLPFLQSLHLVRNASGNVVLADIVDEMSSFVANGGTISEFILAEPFFPPMVHQLASAGESSGKLSFTLKELSRFYDKQVQRNIKVLIALMEPCMIALMGVLVGGIIISLFLPMFSLVQGLAR